MDIACPVTHHEQQFKIHFKTAMESELSNLEGSLPCSTNCTMHADEDVIADICPDRHLEISLLSPCSALNTSGECEATAAVKRPYNS